MEEISIFLQQNLGISPLETSFLLKQLKEVQFKKNEFLIKQGQKCDTIAFVSQGVFRSFINEDRHELNNDFYLPQTFAVALTSYYTDEPTNSSIQALSDAKVYCINKKQLNKLIEQNPIWLKLLLYISENYFIRKCKRESSFLKDDAAKRLEVTQKLFPNIQQLVTQYHIASYLGIRPQSLSRLKSELR